MKRSQPSFTNVTSPSASVIHISAGVVSASSRKRASLSLTTSSCRARSAAAPSTLAMAWRYSSSSSVNSRGARLWASIQPERRPRVSIGT